MQIRTITRDDLCCIKFLWEKLNAHHLLCSNNFEDHYSTFTFEKRLRNLERSERLIAFVAKDNDDIIGYCIATADEATGEIESIFVDEEYRGKWVGEVLISLSLEWLKEHECTTIRVSIAEGNEQALDFYRKFGFAERLTVMQLKA